MTVLVTLRRGRKGRRGRSGWGRSVTDTQESGGSNRYIKKEKRESMVQDV